MEFQYSGYLGKQSKGEQAARAPVYTKQGPTLAIPNRDPIAHTT